MNFINRFNNFKTSRTNESVFVRDNNYIVGGVEIKSSVITKYITKVKKETGKDLKQYFSESEIAESLVEYIIQEYGDGDTIPVSAILGSDESMESEEDVSSEENDVEVSEDDMDEVESEEELDDEEEIEDPDVETDEDDEDFESIEDNEEDESTDEDEDDGEDSEELPL